MMNFNPEILSTKATHLYNGVKVKVFSYRRNSVYATAEVMEGDSKGKWMTVIVRNLKEIA